VKEEKKDGSLVVSFMVGNFEEIRHTLKRWLPYIKILTPAKLRNEFLADMRGWIVWQEH